MGYYTQYKLQDVQPPEMHQTIKDALTLRAYPVAHGRGSDCGGRATSPWIDDGRWGNVSPGCKWYTCTQDADAVAAEYPVVRFTIVMLGEDDDEWTHTTWGDGKRQPKAGTTC